MYIYSLSAIPYSLLAIPYSLLAIPYSFRDWPFLLRPRLLLHVEGAVGKAQEGIPSYSPQPIRGSRQTNIINL